MFCWYGSSLYADQIPRDPTEPLARLGEVNGVEVTENSKRSDSEYVLQEIRISGSDKFAIINNKLIKVGDSVGTHQVKKIEAYYVTLAGETGETVLALFGSPIKKPVKAGMKEPAK